MRRSSFIFLCVICVGCSSDDASFPGVWDGTLPLIANSCPFDGPPNQNQILPIAVTEGTDGQLNVLAADGSSGPAVENDPESFQVTEPVFGIPVTTKGSSTNTSILVIGIAAMASDGSIKNKDDKIDVIFIVDYSSCFRLRRPCAICAPIISAASHSSILCSRISFMRARFSSFSVSAKAKHKPG